MLELEKILKALTATDVEFIVVGGVAATVHGSAQVTYDLDICYERKPENLRRLVQALHPFHPRLRGKDLPANLPFVFDEKTLSMGFNFHVGN